MKSTMIGKRRKIYVIVMSEIMLSKDIEEIVKRAVESRDAVVK